mmetsp:Transcript_103778/g.334573  ORF Transcript_103778/g.334573 Transcript_103778/m.334573 type:complete len:305 (+) Transcript_103778:2075-2989(+)
MGGRSVGAALDTGLGARERARVALRRAGLCAGLRTGSAGSEAAGCAGGAVAGEAAGGADGAVAVYAGMARPARPTGQAPAAGTVGAARVAAAAGSAGTPTGAVVRFVGAQVEGGGQEDEDDEAQGHEVDDSLRGPRQGQGAALQDHTIEGPPHARVQSASHRVPPVDAALVAQQVDLALDIFGPRGETTVPSLYGIIILVQLLLNSRDVLKDFVGPTRGADRRRVSEKDLVPQVLVQELQTSLLNLQAKQLLLKLDLGLAGHALRRRRWDVGIGPKAAPSGQETDDACRRVQSRAASRARRRHR